MNQQIASVNLEVAKLARQDGNLMKSIALLGMVFLPGTFVAVSTRTIPPETRESGEIGLRSPVAIPLYAFPITSHHLDGNSDFFQTFFSMDFFDWPMSGNKMVSSYIWIYVVCTALLTALSLITFYTCALKGHERKKVINDDSSPV